MVGGPSSSLFVLYTFCTHGVEWFQCIAFCAYLLLHHCQNFRHGRPALTLSYSMVQSVGIHIHLSFAAMSTVN